jgi:hypothetical protein
VFRSQSRHQPRLRFIAGAIGERLLSENRPLGDSISGYHSGATHADSLLALLEDKAADIPTQLAAKTALRAKFTAYELPADFVADLRADTDALRAASMSQQADSQEGVENTSAIGTLLGKGQSLVTQLDAIMHNKYARQPDTLRAWMSASHVEHATTRQKKPIAAPRDAR